MASYLNSGGFGRGFTDSSGQVVDVYLNLTPLMDVMSNILFFLLAAFGATAVAVLSLTVPVESPAETTSEPSKPEDKVTVSMRADKAGLSLACQNPAKLPEELKVCERRLNKVKGEYDYQAVTQALKEIKTAFPGATTLLLVPDDSLHYGGIVRLLDAAREIKQATGKKLNLFPDVVLSKLVE